MANYFFTETAKFKPFTYQEMLAPIVAYKEAYDTNETVLNTLLEDAATKGFNFRANDTKEKAAYDSMIDRIKNAASSMATQGLNNQVFNEIRSINKDYRTTMIPIQKKLAKRQELIDEQRKLKASNQNLLFTKDYETASLDDVTGDSTYDIVDLDKIIEDSVTDFTKFIASEGVKYSDPIKISGTNSSMVESGYGYKEDDWKQEIANKDSRLNKKINSYLNDNRLDKLPEEVKKSAQNRIYNAIYSNKGVFEQQIVKDSSKSDKFYDWLPGATQDEQGNITGTIVTKSGQTFSVTRNADGSFKYTKQSNNNNYNNSSSGFPTVKKIFKLIGNNLEESVYSLNDIEKSREAQTHMNRGEYQPASIITQDPNQYTFTLPSMYEDYYYDVVKMGDSTYVRVYNTKNDEGDNLNAYDNPALF